MDGMLGGFKNKPYLCNVFFIVLDLRLTKVWGAAAPLFLSTSPIHPEPPHAIMWGLGMTEGKNYKITELQITIRSFGRKKTKILNIYLILYNNIYIII